MAGHFFKQTHHKIRRYDDTIVFLVCLAHEATSHASANKSNLVKEVLVLKLQRTVTARADPAYIWKTPDFISYTFMAYLVCLNQVAFKRNQQKL